VDAAQACGLDRTGGPGQLTDELIGAVVGVVRPERPRGMGTAWEALAGQREQLAAWLAQGLTLTKVHVQLGVSQVGTCRGGRAPAVAWWSRIARCTASPSASWASAARRRPCAWWTASRARLRAEPAARPLRDHGRPAGPRSGARRVRRACVIPLTRAKCPTREADTLLPQQRNSTPGGGQGSWCRAVQPSTGGTSCRSAPDLRTTCAAAVAIYDGFAASPGG
jgi:hypothetical protein